MSELDCLMEKLSSRGPETVACRKLLWEHGPNVRWALAEADGEWAAALSVPTEASAFDSAAYPDAERIVCVASTPCGDAAGLIGALPRVPTVFKLYREEHRRAAEAAFSLRRATAYVSFACDGVSGATDPAVVVERAVNPPLLPLWAQNGYDDRAVGRFFARGAFSCTRYEGGAPASTCLAFPIGHDGLWEVGAVRTTPGHRGKGYAREVVRAALAELLRQGRTIRYQTEEGNMPSIRLAESAGLREALRLVHYVAQPLEGPPCC